MSRANECPEAIRAFGHDLNIWLQSQGQLLPIYATWLQGGCWLLAEALHQWVGPEAKLMAIHDTNNILHHVAVDVRGCYLDADGASSKKELLWRWQLREGLIEPRLKVFRRRQARAFEIECPAVVKDEIVAALEETFGSGRHVLDWAKIT